MIEKVNEMPIVEKKKSGKKSEFCCNDFKVMKKIDNDLGITDYEADNEDCCFCGKKTKHLYSKGDITIYR